MIHQKIERQGQSLVRTIEVGGGKFISSIKDLADPDLAPSNAWWQSFLRGADCLSIQDPSKKLRVVDAFCGSGGLSLGVSLAAAGMGYGVEFLSAVDTDRLALEVHKANFRSKPLLSSVSSLVDFHIWGQGNDVKFGYMPEPLHDALEFYDPIDIFVAGPPCEGHSNLNNHTRRADPRNNLYTTAVALGVSLRSKCIIIENVPTVLRDKSDVVPKAEALLRGAGYSVWSGVLKADEIGGAQRRSRFFLIAIKGKIDTSIDLIDVVRSALQAPPSPVSWAIGDLLDRSPDGLLDTAANLNAVNADRIDYLFDNDLHDLPDAQRPDCHKNGTTYSSVYGRMHWDRPAQTITTGFNTPGQGRYIHPIRRRVITPREAARLQSFPDTFVFLPPNIDVKRAHLAKWIGDAVPPVLGYAAGLAALSAAISMMEEGVGSLRRAA
jgi:DNA (cytosine-5)-methyltransferase 1